MQRLNCFENVKPSFGPSAEAEMPNPRAHENYPVLNQSGENSLLTVTKLPLKHDRSSINKYRFSRLNDISVLKLLIDTSKPDSLSCIY
jgi:hypothetical protein